MNESNNFYDLIAENAELKRQNDVLTRKLFDLSNAVDHLKSWPFDHRVDDFYDLICSLDHLLVNNSDSLDFNLQLCQDGLEYAISHTEDVLTEPLTPSLMQYITTLTTGYIQKRNKRISNSDIEYFLKPFFDDWDNTKLLRNLYE